jgi:hypothetical protein
MVISLLYNGLEFLMSNLELQNALTEEKLKESFNFFDKVRYTLNIRMETDTFLLKN